MIRTFSFVALVSITWASQVAAQQDDFRVHALLVIDTAADSKLTHGLAKAGQRMERLLEGLPQADRQRLRVTVLQGERATPDAIRAYYRGLDSRPMDVLFFYYMGHGTVAKDRKNGKIWNADVQIDFGSRNAATGVSSAYPESSDPRYHVLALEHGWMSRVEVYQLMLGRPSRACILFADCCGNFYHGESGELEGPKDSPVEVARRFASRMRGGTVRDSDLESPGTINPALWRCLFYEHMGLIDLGGAPVGYFGLACSIYGGLSSFAFTESLCASDQTFRKLLNEKANWPQTNGMPDWRMFTECYLTPQYCKDFPQRRSERKTGGEERIYSYGPRLFDPFLLVFHTPRVRQLSNSTAVFGDTICCRIQPTDGKGGGFYPVFQIDGQGVNIYNRNELFDKLMARKVSKLQLGLPYDMASGAKDTKTFELSIRPAQ